MLGYDVAEAGAAFYSVVGDFPDEDKNTVHFQKLNEHGLFSNPKDAEEYLQYYDKEQRRLAEEKNAEYRRQGYPEYYEATIFDLLVWEIRLVNPNPA